MNTSRNDSDDRRQDAHTIRQNGNRQGGDTSTALAAVARQIAKAADEADREKRRRGDDR